MNSCRAGTPTTGSRDQGCVDVCVVGEDLLLETNFVFVSVLTMFPRGTTLFAPVPCTMYHVGTHVVLCVSIPVVRFNPPPRRARASLRRAHSDCQAPYGGAARAEEEEIQRPHAAWPHAVARANRGSKTDQETHRGAEDSRGGRHKSLRSTHHGTVQAIGPSGARRAARQAAGGPARQRTLEETKEESKSRLRSRQPIHQQAYHRLHRHPRRPRRPRRPFFPRHHGSRPRRHLRHHRCHQHPCGGRRQGPSDGGRLLSGGGRHGAFQSDTDQPRRAGFRTVASAAADGAPARRDGRRRVPALPQLRAPAGADPPTNPDPDPDH